MNNNPPLEADGTETLPMLMPDRLTFAATEPVEVEEKMTPVPLLNTFCISLGAPIISTSQLLFEETIQPVVKVKLKYFTLFDLNNPPLLITANEDGATDSLAPLQPLTVKFCTLTTPLPLTLKMLDLLPLL
jgi:hypothetical protein